MPEKKHCSFVKGHEDFLLVFLFVCYAGGCTQFLYMQGKHGLVNYILL